MTVREYIGARYVPLFMGDWDITADYEPLSIVQYQGASYTSRQSVPHGVPITDTHYWAVTGNYNAQVEAYRQEVFTFDGRITENAGDIDDIQTTIGSSFDTAHTITDYAANVDASIEDVEEIIGDGFSAENTIADNIAELDSKIDAAKVAQLAEPSFDIKQRIVMEASTYEGRSLQAGCIFKQDNALYWAQWMASDDASLVDWLLIIDVATGTILKRITLEIGHGQNLTYNPNTKELFVCGGSAGYYISVATPASASVVRAVELPDIDGQGKPSYVAWDDKTYEFFYVLKQTSPLGVNYMRVYKTTTDFVVVSHIDIKVNDYLHRNWQSIDVKDGLLYYCNTSPEYVAIYNVTTGERLNVINMPQYVNNFLRVEEIESAYVVDGVMYVTQINAYPGYRVPALFAWDMVHGSAGIKTHQITSNSDPSVTNNMRYVRVAWTRANICEPWDTSSDTGASTSVPSFKFVDDALNYCRYNEITPRLSFVDDYPSYAIIENMRLAVAPENTVEVGGLSFHNCQVSFVNASRLTFTGEGAAALSSSTYQHAMRFEDSLVTANGTTMWNIDAPTGLTGSSGTFNRCVCLFGQIADIGVAVFNSCITLIRSTGHASTVNQNHTAFIEA